MKTIKRILLLVLVMSFTSINSQEKKIKFSKGTLRICSAKNFEITGYDGKEVVIKSLYKKNTLSWGYKVGTTKSSASYPKATTIGKASQNKKGTVTYFLNHQEKKRGLKKLGKNNENKELGIYFKIEQKNGELIFSDEVPSATGRLVMYGNESYEIKIPNSLKLAWETNGCVNKNRDSKTRLFYNSNPSSLSSFNGEVDIKSTLSNIKLVDVTGPVSINTIGGNVTIEFDKRKPNKLYSVYSNNGFIDITLPENSNTTLDVIGESVYSDLNFKIENEQEVNDFGHIKTLMKLKQGTGKIRMKLDAGYGNIYLRKKK